MFNLSLASKLKLISKNARNLSQNVNSTKSQSLDKWILGLGCGTLGLTLGLMYDELLAKINTENVQEKPAVQLKERKILKPERLNINEAISQSRLLAETAKISSGIPGMVIAVSVDGKLAWSEGFGFSDLENKVPCSKNTVMRIASISKSITMTAAAKLWENNKLDLDKSILEYLPDYPTPKYNNKEVVITPRQIASHSSGIRHYSKTLPTEKKSDGQLIEFYSKENYANVKDALKIFQNDPLLLEPGKKFLYTTHGYTVLSAIIEAVAKEPFSLHIMKMFQELGMNNTYLDINDTLIGNRSRYYYLKNGKIMNSPYVDNSNKWAGGGFLSTVHDLIKFGNVMLYSAQLTNTNSNKLLPGYLKSDTVLKLWEPVIEAYNNSMYGLGWAIIPPKQEYGYCKVRRFVASHTGGAVGASSVLLILPRVCYENNSEDKLTTRDCQWEKPPKGIVVAVLVNLQDVGLSKLASEIAETFEKVEL